MDKLRIVPADYPGQCFLFGMLLVILFMVGPIAIFCLNDPASCTPATSLFTEIRYGK